MRQRHRRRGAGDAGHVVVFGHPVAVKAQRLGVGGEIRRIQQRLPGRTAFGDGGEIKNGKMHHGRSIGRDIGRVDSPAPREAISRPSLLTNLWNAGLRSYAAPAPTVQRLRPSFA